MKIKATLASLILTFSMTLTQPANALFGIGDVVFDPTAAANMIRELAYWTQQLQQMHSQLVTQTGTLNALTGNRGYGNLMMLANTARNYLPQGAQDLQCVINNTCLNYSGMSNQVQALIQQNAVLSNSQLNGMRLTPAQQQLLNDERANNAAIQSITSQGMSNASARFNYLQYLMQQINTTTDAKTIAELQARIEAEQTMMTNEQTKLQQVQGLLQGKSAMIMQQKRELAIQQTGDIRTIQQPNLSNITYN